MDMTTPNMQDGLWIRSRWYVGVDLGQAHDPTACAVLETKYAEIPPGTWGHNLRFLEEAIKEYKSPYYLRWLERLPLDIPYPDQVAYVMNLVNRPPLQKPHVLVDFSGVGRPVFDLFQRARMQNLSGISITGGNKIHRQPYGWSVPKLQLMSKLQALLHCGQLRVAPQIKDTKVLLRELKDFRATFTSAGNAIFNAREGAHDDLVLSLAMAVFGATLPQPPKDIKIRFAM